jgi:lipoyl-dependent peroxiredoxin
MAIRTSTATWQGDLKGGSGTMALGSGAFEGGYSYSTRFEEEPGSNPEELIGAALAGCFSMFLSGQLANEGVTAERIETEARVHLGRDDTGAAITRIELSCTVAAPGVDPGTFDELVRVSKENCPVSKALRAVAIEVEARLG